MNDMGSRIKSEHLRATIYVMKMCDFLISEQGPHTRNYYSNPLIVKTTPCEDQWSFKITKVMTLCPNICHMTICQEHVF